jgi:hypothetical protein
MCEPATAVIELSHDVVKSVTNVTSTEDDEISSSFNLNLVDIWRYKTAKSAGRYG